MKHLLFFGGLMDQPYLIMRQINAVMDGVEFVEAQERAAAIAQKAAEDLRNGR